MEEKIKFRDLPGVYPEAKKTEDKKILWNYYILRPISFWIAPAFIKVGFSANKVSILGIAVSILAATLMIFGGYPLILASAILFILWNVLDGVDGDVARYRKTFTLLGAFLEEINGAIVVTLFFSSVGVAAFKTPGFLPEFIKLPFFWFIIFGILTSFFIIFRHVVYLHYRSIFLENEKTKSDAFYGKSSVSFLYSLVVNFSGISSLAQPLLILAIIFNSLGAYIMIYFAIHILIMLGTTIFLLLKANNQSKNNN